MDRDICLQRARPNPWPVRPQCARLEAETLLSTSPHLDFEEGLAWCALRSLHMVLLTCSRWGRVNGTVPVCHVTTQDANLERKSSLEFSANSFGFPLPPVQPALIYLSSLVILGSLQRGMTQASSTLVRAVMRPVEFSVKIRSECRSYLFPLTSSVYSGRSHDCTSGRGSGQFFPPSFL